MMKRDAEEPRSALLQPPAPRFGARHLLVATLTLCNMCMYLVRANMSVAVTYMYPGDPAAGATALSSFYWGYLVSQVAAGWLATRVGAAPVLGSAVAVWALASFLTTPAAGWLPGLVATRIVLGIAQGANYPSQAVLAAQWVPQSERSRAWACLSSGESIGTILALAGCPALAAAEGWGAIFYASGALCVAWVLLFACTAASTPERHAASGRCFRATAAEVDLIAAQRGDLDAPAQVPWRQILTNGPFVATVVAHICYNWGYYVVLSWLPTYFKSMFAVDFAALGFAGMCPYLGLFVFGTGSGWLADRLRARGMRLATVRKCCNTVGFLIPAACFFALRVVQPCAAGSPCPGFGRAVALLTGGVAAGGCAFSGFWATFLDLSPRYAGHLMGISNTLATLPGIASNLLVGALLQGRGDDWDTVFGLAAFIYIIGSVVFVVFGRSHVQAFDSLH